MTRSQNLLGLQCTNTGLEDARGGTDASGLNHPATTPRLSEDSLVEQSNSVETPSCMAFQHQCRALCSCVCHTRDIVRSSWMLDTIVGKIKLQYTGRRPSCNEFHCRRPSESSFKVLYHLPKFLMSRYISHGHAPWPFKLPGTLASNATDSVMVSSALELHHKWRSISHSETICRAQSISIRSIPTRVRCSVLHWESQLFLHDQVSSGTRSGPGSTE